MLFGSPLQVDQDETNVPAAIEQNSSKMIPRINIAVGSNEFSLMCLLLLLCFVRSSSGSIRYSNEHSDHKIKIADFSCHGTMDTIRVRVSD